jgi:periplasmic protein TonB
MPYASHVVQWVVADANMQVFDTSEDNVPPASLFRMTSSPLLARYAPALAVVALLHIGALAWLLQSLRDMTPYVTIESRPIMAELLKAPPAVAVQSEPSPAPKPRPPAATPRPAVPKPAVPKPAVPKPAVPKPAVPKPAVPVPAVPKPPVKAVTPTSMPPTPKRDSPSPPAPAPVTAPDAPSTPVTNPSPAPADAAQSAPAPRPVVAQGAPKGVAKLDCQIVAPEYPALSRRREETGTVVINLVLDTSGKVERATVKKSSGHDRLDDAARAAALSSACHPYVENGEPIRVSADQPYVFNLGD